MLDNYFLTNPIILLIDIVLQLNTLLHLITFLDHRWGYLSTCEYRFLIHLINLCCSLRYPFRNADVLDRTARCNWTLTANLFPFKSDSSLICIYMLFMLKIHFLQSFPELPNFAYNFRNTCSLCCCVMLPSKPD